MASLTEGVVLNGLKFFDSFVFKRNKSNLYCMFYNLSFLIYFIKLSSKVYMKNFSFNDEMCISIRRM